MYLSLNEESILGLEGNMFWSRSDRSDGFDSKWKNMDVLSSVWCRRITLAFLGTQFHNSPQEVCPWKLHSGRSCCWCLGWWGMLEQKLTARKAQYWSREHRSAPPVRPGV